MNLKIIGRHVEVTDALRDYVTGKLERVVRHFDNVTSCSVTLSVEKLNQKAEVTLHVRGKDIFVESSDGDMYAAIDNMVDRLDRRVLKYKQKNQAHGHDSHRNYEATDKSA